MNKKPNNSAWILCRSKSYPGKFYYFNILNGETAWCFNENEQVTNTKLMWNQNTPTEQDIKNVYTHTFPLSKQFENKINRNIGSINYVAATTPKDWWNSTNVWSNIGKHSGNTDMQYKRKLSMKPILKESKLNKPQHRDSTQLHCNKVENPKTMLDKMSFYLDSNDLRYVLRARQRKPVVMRNPYNKVNREYSTFYDTNKRTYIRDNNTFNSEEKYIGGRTAFTINENQQTSEWYLVVDLDVLLEDYEFIKSYINKDENCHLYVPSVIQNQLKIISKEEYCGRSRVVVARKLLRYLGAVTRLNLPEHKEDTRMHQILNCCLEIIKINYDVVLITKQIELIQTAKLYKIKAYHINTLKSNDLENNIQSYNKPNLFLQNIDDFDPFGLSKIIQANNNNCKQNISGTYKSKYNYNLNVNKNNLDISDIDTYFSKLTINDKTLTIKSNVKNKIVKSNCNTNCNFKTFHNISINRTIQRNSNENIQNRTFNKRDNINITFNTYKENKECYTDVKLIPEPLNEVHEQPTNIIFDNMLKKFHIKNSVMENNLYLRFDECVCSFEQIIEEFLYIVLQKNLQQVNQPPPWFLHEGMKCLKEIYRDNNYIIQIIEKLLYYYDLSTGYGSNLKPYNFMKLFGCSFYLVETLEITSPVLISDIKKQLIYLKNMLECPIEDLIVDDCGRSGRYTNTEDKHTFKNNIVKNPSDVLDYLKKNFSEWKNYYEGHDNTNQIEQKQGCGDNIKVLRTFGKDVNKITINKSKYLYITKETDKQTHKHDFQANDYPKVIRNIKILDTIEEKIEGNKSGCPKTAETISSTSFDGNVNKVIINDRVSESNDLEIVSLNSKNNSSINDINDSTKDSGSNSLLTYSLVRTFLSELSSSFKMIHTFINESIKNYNEDMSEENKRNLYEKANKTYTHLAEIIEKLKIIIERESKESSTLTKAGSDDKRTTRYRPVVMKCLEQAKILEKSLKLILSITNDEVISVTSEENLLLINIDE